MSNRFSFAMSASTLSLIATIFAIPPGFAAPQDAEGVPASEMEAAGRLEIERSLSQELQSAADRQNKLPGQTKFDVSVSLSTEQRTLAIDLGKNSIPSRNSFRVEEQCHSLITTAMSIVDGIVSVNGYECTYGGKDIFHYHPEEMPVVKKKALTTTQDDPLAIVMVSGGHGYYFNTGTNTWEPQRPLVNGMREDFVTPYYAQDVSYMLINRAHLSVAKARTNGITTHTPSGHQWWRMSARTYLAEQYPDNPEVWNSLSNDNDPQGEIDDDIRARPLFAEHVGARYSLHIHSNAADDDSIRGTTGWYQTGRDADREYTARILCAMKETIQANSNYATWKVDLSPHSANKGENRLTPNSRSTIIELGFHTNASDATALQSATFRRQAVAGMEKGIRLYHKGKQCTDFKIDSIPTVSGPVNTPFNYYINFSGNPTFPVTMHSTVVSCASGWSCPSFTRTENSPQDSQLMFTIHCTSSTPGQSGTFRYKRWLVDADGVKTQPVEHTYTCNAAS